MAGDRTVVREGPFAQFIPEGVRVGDHVTLSGQVSVDAEGEVVAPGDVVAQARHAYTHVAAALAKLGAAMGDVVDETFFVTDVADAMGRIDELWQVRHEAYSGTPDVSQTMVQVGGLVLPDLVIEIKVVAIAGA